MSEDLDSLKGRVNTFLENLTLPEKRIVELYYYKEKTVPDIAKHMELSETKVSKILEDIISRCEQEIGKGL